MLYELLSGEVEPWEIAPRFSDLLSNTSVQFYQDRVKLLHPSSGILDNGSERSKCAGTVHVESCLLIEYDCEPKDYECNGLHKHSKIVSTGTLTSGLLTTAILVVYFAFRAGAGKSLLPLDRSHEEEEKENSKPVSYSYSFFHIIFSLASMYSAMLLTGWSTSVGSSGKLIDVGWPSVWVRVITEWVTAALYIWSMVAPLLFPEREF